MSVRYTKCKVNDSSLENKDVFVIKMHFPFKYRIAFLSKKKNEKREEFSHVSGICLIKPMLTSGPDMNQCELFAGCFVSFPYVIQFI